MSGTSICVEMPRFAACAGLTTESSALTTDDCLGSSAIASSSLATPARAGLHHVHRWLARLDFSEETTAHFNAVAQSMLTLGNGRQRNTPETF